MRIKAILATFTSLCAAALSFSSHADNNFLLGVEMGVENRNAELVSNFVVPSPPLAAPGLTLPTNTPGSSVSDSGVVFGVLGGWQWQDNRWVLGIEGNVDFQSFERNHEHVFNIFPNGLGGATGGVFRGQVIYDRGPTFSLSARAGYFLTPFFMPYIRGGGQVSRDEMTYNLFVYPVPLGPQGSTIVPNPTSRKETIWGWLIGIGLEFPAIGPSSVRFEYNYNATGQLTIDDGDWPIYGTHKFERPRSHIAKAAWVWNFM